MAKKAYGRRYAQAVFELALEKKELEKWQADLQKMAGAAAVADFLAVMESPKLRFEDKEKLAAGVLGDVGPLALNLARLLISKNSFGLVGEIAAEYGRLLDAYQGIAQAEVITAVPMDERELQLLTEKLGAAVGRKVVIKPQVDPDVIGGVVARIDGKLLDGSTRSKLAALRRELVDAGARR